MTAVEYPSQDFYSVRQNVLYTTSSLASSATASVCSDASSQYSHYSDHSNSTSTSTSFSDSASHSHTFSSCRQGLNNKPQVHISVSEPHRSLRQNARRTSNTATTRTGCPPPLVRQAERKLNFVDNLVDSSTQIVEAIWPTSSVTCREETNKSGVLPLRTFIQETLRRSRTSYSTLQVALYYLVLIKDQLPERDFTMEQTDESHSSRALQCGRRMFLAALILASKYLQDRNYSARAWSKISGLNTQEINQNEMSFLLAVNWNLHITEQVYQRWTDSVMKYSSSQPPSPGSGLSSIEFEHQCDYFKRIIRRLDPDLENLDDILSIDGSSPAPTLSPRSLSPRSVLAAAHDDSASFGRSLEDPNCKPRIYRTPSTLEPSLRSVRSAGRLAPAFGLLPTPRLTPQVSAVRDLSPPHMMGATSAMSMAVNTANAVQSGTFLERWGCSITSSPQSSQTPRRSSLAFSVSTASSPESMVSDTSGTSRSSSISSISSLASAPYPKFDYTNLEVQARCRSAKMMGERHILRHANSFSEDTVPRLTSSPSYVTHGSRRDFEVDDATNDAARALQELHDNWQRSCVSRSAVSATSAPVAGSKRGRGLSMEHSLQDSVRDLLRGESRAKHASTAGQDTCLQIPASSHDGRKRVCCSAEAAQAQIPSMHPSMGGLEGPGMWQGILH